MLTGLKAWLWLTDALDCGPAWQVLRHFDTPEQAYFADPAEYELIPKLTPAHRARLRNKSLQRADQILADCDAAGISILTWQDSLYPERLRNIDLPPLVLYWRGTLPRFDEEIAIAMAGTRTATPYGRMAAGQLAYQITRLGGLVLTGVVAGCDHHAADGALKAGGPLVCVTAGGVDVPYYNTDNGRRLLEDAAACGAVLSEYPPRTPHLADHFAMRNRLLTGLALGTVCIEAPERSGTLNVARLALEQGRDVFAVPANIDAAASVGTNRLLARGEAICVCSGADVLEHYRALYPQQVKETAISDAIQSQRLSNPPEEPEGRAKPTSPAEPESSIPSDSSLSTAPAPSGAPALREIRLSEHASEFTDDEQAILNALADGEQITDTIVDATGIPARRVSAALTVLTIRALVRQKSGGRFEALVKLI